MKKLATLLTLMAGVGLGFGQAIVHNSGSVQFLNTQTQHTTGNNNWHVVTNSATSQALVGTQYYAELYYMNTAGSLQPVASSLFTGGFVAGKWNGAAVALPSDIAVAGASAGNTVSGGGVDIDTSIGGVEAGTDAPGFTSPNQDGLYPVQLQVRVWDSTHGSTYETAPAGFRGASPIFVFTQRASASPPALTDNQMIGQPGFIVQTPEPSAIALSVLGVASLLFLRRRKS